MKFLVNLIILIVMMLVSVAFITLMERKILGFMQYRPGPNKVGPMGILQPMADAVKLYTKEYNKPYFSNKTMFFVFPILSLSMSFILWIFMPYLKSLMTINLQLMIFMLVLGGGVYSSLFMGWSSNSNYSNIGSIRSVAQTISYEISLSFIIISVFLMNKSMQFCNLSQSQKFMWNISILPTFLMWLMSCLAELNRTPFDLSEAESELVSGFNTEFSGGKFAMIFMAEYMMIILLSNMTSIMFLGCLTNSFMFFINSSLIMFFILWARATLPRMRYDKLMLLTWTMFLPSSMLMIMFLFPSWNLYLL